MASTPLFWKQPANWDDTVGFRKQFPKQGVEGRHHWRMGGWKLATLNWRLPKNLNGNLP
jgi:hypothetical protein